MIPDSKDAYYRKRRGVRKARMCTVLWNFKTGGARRGGRGVFVSFPVMLLATDHESRSTASRGSAYPRKECPMGGYGSTRVRAGGTIQKLGQAHAIETGPWVRTTSSLCEKLASSISPPSALACMHFIVSVVARPSAATKEAMAVSHWKSQKKRTHGAVSVFRAGPGKDEPMGKERKRKRCQPMLHWYVHVTLFYRRLCVPAAANIDALSAESSGFRGGTYSGGGV